MLAAKKVGYSVNQVYLAALFSVFFCWYLMKGIELLIKVCLERHSAHLGRGSDLCLFCVSLVSSVFHLLCPSWWAFCFWSFFLPPCFSSLCFLIYVLFWTETAKIAGCVMLGEFFKLFEPEFEGEISIMFLALLVGFVSMFGALCWMRCGCAVLPTLSPVLLWLLVQLSLLTGGWCCGPGPTARCECDCLFYASAAAPLLERLFPIHKSCFKKKKKAKVPYSLFSHP